MTYTNRRRFRGGIQAVILDWAGTIIDFGCVAPAVVFQQVFEREGVPIAMAEARAPMGAAKRDHIEAIAALPAVAKRWTDAHGAGATDNDIDRMYAAFVPLQLDCLTEYADLIPGTVEAAAEMRARGYRIGTCTGYDRDMTDLLLSEATKQGFEPDTSVCADDVTAGRPAPFMCFQNAMNLQAWPVEACVKVDDTLVGIEAGLNAGMWSLGVATSGNEVGLSLAEFRALGEEERERRVGEARERMRQCGAHLVIDTVADLVGCLDAIEDALRRGLRPGDRLGSFLPVISNT